MNEHPRGRRTGRHTIVRAMAACLACLSAGAAAAADLDRTVTAQRPRWHYLPEEPPLDAPRPTSSGGYYGYYGTDIAGVPYEGLYSLPPVCLRSVRTPEGYRTVDACR